MPLGIAGGRCRPRRGTDRCAIAVRRRGPALGRFEAPLKSAGLWPAPSFTAKHAKSSLQGYLYKRLHKYARLSRLDRVTKEFVVGCLDLDPDNRYSVRQALAHPYFSAHPQACSPAE